MLTRETWKGPWAGLPVAWQADGELDEPAYRADVARCCRAGVPGVYTGGTTGEFYAMELDEFQRVARATVEVCHAHDVPAMIGCTSTYTRGAARRAAVAAEVGADAIQIALPFWMEVDDAQIVPFFREVAAGADGLAMSVYETDRAKKRLTLDQHRAINEAVPRYLMVKANAGTLGAGAEGCAALSQFVNVFVGEGRWAELGPRGVRGCCSSVVYWNPRVTLALWERVEKKDWPAVEDGCRRLDRLFAFLDEQFADRGFTDTAYDRLGGLATGFLQTSLANRGPYPAPTPADVARLAAWFRESLPEMLEW